MCSASAINGVARTCSRFQGVIIKRNPRFRIIRAGVVVLEKMYMDMDMDIYIYIYG